MVVAAVVAVILSGHHHKFAGRWFLKKLDIIVVGALFNAVRNLDF